MLHVAATRELPRHFSIHNRHELIQAAAVRVAAAKGHRATTVSDICEEAHISSKCFHEHFSNVEEAVLTAVEAGVDQVMADIHDAMVRAPSWPSGMWDGLDIFTDYMACEPSFARATVLELLSIGPSGLELLRSLMDAFALFLEPGYFLLDDVEPKTLDQTITGRMFEMLHTHVSIHQPETVPTLLPDLVRVALNPFLGLVATEEFVASRLAAL